MKGYRTSLYLYTKRWIESQSIKWCVVASTAAVDAYQWFIKKQLHLFISYFFSLLFSPKFEWNGGGDGHVQEMEKKNKINKGGKKHKTIRISGNRLVFRGCGAPIVIWCVFTHRLSGWGPDTPVEVRQINFVDGVRSIKHFSVRILLITAIQIHAQVI